MAALDIPANHRDFGYIAGIEHRGGTTYLTFDRAIFYTGDDANRYAAAHGMETPVPNDYVIANDNPKLRHLPVSAHVQLLESIQLGHPPPGDNVRGPFSDLENLSRSPGLRAADAVPLALRRQRPR